MREDFLHFVWQHALFDSAGLMTTDGQPVQLIDRGSPNKQSGPDFSDARIRVGHTLWAGHVEIHITSSDWYRHGHQGDGAYHNVVLHVVYNDDKPVVLPNGVAIPTIELKNRISEEQYWRYERWLNGDGRKILCAGHIASTPDHILAKWLDTMSRERLERKSDEVMKLLEISEGNTEWTEAVFSARAFGKPLNSAGMEELARRMPWRNMKRRNWTLCEFVKLALTMSGLTDIPRDTHLFKLWALTPLSKRWWRWGKMRPASFPHIRVQHWAWWNWHRIVAGDVDIGRMLHPEKGDWKVAGFKKVSPVIKTRESWFINTYGPLFHAYRRWGLSEATLSETAQWQNLPPEGNSTVALFEKYGAPVHSAADSQALIHCFSNYCSAKKCISCQLGMHYLKK